MTLCLFGEGAHFTEVHHFINTTLTWGDEVICFFGGGGFCTLNSDCVLNPFIKKKKEGGGENSAQILMRRDWQTDKGGYSNTMTAWQSRHAFYGDE